MKRITIALCATFLSLSSLAQGTLQQRLQGNPKIDSLVSKVAALGGNREVTYYYDGKLHKSVFISCQQLNDFKPTPPTGDPKRDAQSLKIDSIRKERGERASSIFHLVRNTFM